MNTLSVNLNKHSDYKAKTLRLDLKMNERTNEQTILKRMDQIGLVNYFVITGNHLGANILHSQFTQCNGGSNPTRGCKTGHVSQMWTCGAQLLPIYSDWSQK